MAKTTKPAEPSITESAPDPFDLDALRLPQDFTEGLGVKKLLTTIPVRKPHPQWFVRVHPEMRLNAAILELADTGDVYIVTKGVVAELAEHLKIKTLLLAITRHGLLFIWPVKLPDELGRLDDWSRSALTAAKEAESRWVALKSDRHAGCYQIGVAAANSNIPDPDWKAATQDKSFKELLRIAFQDRIIDRPDYPVIAQLRGAV
jgi:hypothetical protein